MAERIQLKEPGSELVMLVSSVHPETVERNDYYRFGNGKVELLVPQSSVKAQFERLGIEQVDFMIGKTVRFGRSMKMSRANKPFWDIDFASPTTERAERSNSAGGEMGKPTAGTSASAPSAEPARTKLTKLYLDATEFVIDKVLPKYAEAGIVVSDTAIIAAVATLFIAGSKER